MTGSWSRTGSARRRARAAVEAMVGTGGAVAPLTAPAERDDARRNQDAAEAAGSRAVGAGLGV
jgi:hypothetical protein